MKTLTIIYVGGEEVTFKNCLQWNFFGNFMIIDFEGDHYQVIPLEKIHTYSWKLQPMNREQRRKK